MTASKGLEISAGPGAPVQNRPSGIPAKPGSSLGQDAAGHTGESEQASWESLMSDLRMVAKGPEQTGAEQNPSPVQVADLNLHSLRVPLETPLARLDAQASSTVAGLLVAKQRGPADFRSNLDRSQVAESSDIQSKPLVAEGDAKKTKRKMNGRDTQVEDSVIPQNAPMMPTAFQASPASAQVLAESPGGSEKGSIISLLRSEDTHSKPFNSVGFDRPTSDATIASLASPRTNHLLPSNSIDLPDRAQAAPPNPQFDEPSGSFATVATGSETSAPPAAKMDAVAKDEIGISSRQSKGRSSYAAGPSDAGPSTKNSAATYNARTVSAQPAQSKNGEPGGRFAAAEVRTSPGNVPQEENPIATHLVGHEKLQVDHQSATVQQGIGLGNLQEVPAIRASMSVNGSPAAESNLPPSTNPPLALREPFAALDAIDGRATPTWVHAGARQAEAGFQDPGLGWVGVRAHVDSVGVHATLVPSSADAAQSLGGHLADLNAYLAERHASIDKVTLAAPEARWPEPGLDQGLDHNTGQRQGSGNGAEQNPGWEGESGDRPQPAPGSQFVPDIRFADGVASRDVAVDRFSYLPSGGQHISVMA